MSDLPKPSELAAAAGISPSHASNILAGRREASSEIALNAFRALGVRLGLLADMSDADIAKLCSQKPCDVAECQGGDAVASDADAVLDHAALDSGDIDAPSTGQFGQMSRAVAA